MAPPVSTKIFIPRFIEAAIFPILGTVPGKSDPLKLADTYDLAQPLAKSGDKAKPSDAASSEVMKSLLDAISDQNLFGEAFPKYQAKKTSKYQNVALALYSVREFLKGDASYAAIAVEKIVAWLNDYLVLSDRTVAHQARVNLRVALQKAPDKPEIKEGLQQILKALGDTYPKPFKDLRELQQAASNENLFGNQAAAFKKGKNNKYSKVNSALEVTRSFLRGATSNLDLAKEQIVSWLSDPKVIVDPVAHQARERLINALYRAPDGKQDWNDGVEVLIETLKADYSTTDEAAPSEGNKPKAGESDAPKESAGKAADAAPEDSEDAKKVPTQTIPMVSYSFLSKQKGKRKNSNDDIVAAIRPTFTAAYNSFQKDHPDITIQGTLRFFIDNKTGNIFKVQFIDSTVTGAVKAEDVEPMFLEISQSFNSNLSVEVNGSGSVSGWEFSYEISSQGFKVIK